MTAIQQGMFGGYLAYCSRCGRGLTNPLSVKRGIGPICWKIKGNGGSEMSEILDREVYPSIPSATAREYPYKGFGGCECVCGLQHGSTPSGKNFVILTELPDNPGTSVTNMVEELATQALRQLGLDPANTLIFEHYPERGNKWNPFPESWDLILPDWEMCPDGYMAAQVPHDHHMWKRLTREEVLALIGVAS